MVVFLLGMIVLILLFGENAVLSALGLFVLGALGISAIGLLALFCWQAAAIVAIFLGIIIIAAILHVIDGGDKPYDGKYDEEEDRGERKRLQGLMNG